MCVFAKYKDILGKPGTGVHSWRILNIAVVDVILTLILAFFIWRITGYSIYWILVFIFVLGIVIHWLFCVNSTVNKMIFGEMKC
jgi:fatty-acid desaturase